MPEKHTILGGKVHVYRRDNSSRWQCSTYLAGKNRRVSTKEDSLGKAKDFAEDCYLQLRGKARNGEIRNEKTFREAAAQFEREYQIITEGQRNPIYVKGHSTRLRLHLLPFFGNMGLSEITPGQVQEYRIHRHEEAVKEHGKPPARNTMHQEIVVLRQTLKAAVRLRWLDRLPDLSEPYRASGKISHRAWFSPEEYKQLYEATRRRARSPKNSRYKWESEQLHDYVLFMANTGLRPDEANRLEYRHVKIVKDDPTNETILEIDVREFALRGKQGAHARGQHRRMLHDLPDDLHMPARSGSKPREIGNVLVARRAAKLLQRHVAQHRCGPRKAAHEKWTVLVQSRPL